MTGEPNIADFGLAALEEVAAEAELQLGFFQTRMSYSAPELTRGGGLASPQGDTYSVALLFYRLLAGSNPFRGRSIPETLQRVLQLAPADLMMPEWEGVRQHQRGLQARARQGPGGSLSELSGAEPDAGHHPASQRRESPRGAAGAHPPCSPRRLVAALSPHPLGTTVVAPRARAPGARLRGPCATESKAPAFVSGLVTDQPINVEEHSQSARREVRRSERGAAR